MTKNIRTVRLDRLHDQVVRELALRFLASANNPNPSPAFTVAELCSHFNVSQTVVREAMKVLQSKGLIDVRPKAGIRVRPHGEWNLLDPDVLTWRCEALGGEEFIRDLLQVRRIIEPAAAQIAAAKASEDEIAEMNQWYSRMETTPEDIDDLIAADREFHAAIYAATHNDVLAAINAHIWFAPRISSAILHRLRESPKAGLDLHRAVAEAIANHDGAAARAAAERLVDEAEREIWKVLRSIEAEKPSEVV